MAYDEVTRNIVLFGGITATQTVLGDTWTWDGTTRTWTQQFPDVSPPARRAPIANSSATGTVVLRSLWRRRLSSRKSYIRIGRLTSRIGILARREGGLHLVTSISAAYHCSNVRRGRN
jgi:hypothetical protein